MPVGGYYYTTLVSPGTKGRLYTATGYDNNKKYAALAVALRGDTPKYQFVNMEERTYVHIDYNDLLNRPHSEFYEVHSIGGAIRIDDAAGAQVFAWWDAPLQRISFDQ